MTSARGDAGRPQHRRWPWPIPRSGERARIAPTQPPGAVEEPEVDGPVGPLGPVGRARLAAARLLLERSGTDVLDARSISDLADLHRSAWSALPEHLRWDTRPVLDAVAVAIGDHVIAALPHLEWVGYGPGDEPALRGFRPETGTPAVARPLESSRRHWSAHRARWVLDYVTSLQARLAELSPAGDAAK